MKHNAYIFCLVLMICFESISSQTKQLTPSSYIVNSMFLTGNTQHKQTATTAIDTIKPSSFAASCYTTSPSTSLVLYYADVKTPHDSGYISGTNVYGDLEKAQHFVNSTTTTLTGCAVKIHRSFSSTSTLIGTKVKLYSYSGTIPSTVVIATSNLVPQNTINNNGLTVFSFSTPIVVSSDYVMSVLLPNHVGDTTAIFSTLTSCNSGQSLSWERASDNSWGSMHTNWNFSTTQNIDLAIFPLKQVVVTTDILEIKKDKPYFLMPNPAFDTFSIMKNENSENTANVIITSIAGEIISDFTLTPNSKIDCGQWNSGIYFIHLSDESGSCNLKFIKQ